MRVRTPQWALEVFTPAMVVGKRILDVGALNVNGSLRPVFEGLGCARYLGLDLQAGAGVDIELDICAVSLWQLPDVDIIVSSDMLEHCHDWRGAVGMMKGLLNPGGYLLLCTVAPGYCYHGWPGDFWRFTLEHLRAMFADWEIVSEEPSLPGVIVRKPTVADLRTIEAVAIAQP